MPRTKSYDDVRAAFDEGTVVNASKTELEQLLLAVGRARVLHPANQARAAEMGETMRQLLAARQSEEVHTQVLRVSRLALWISLIALVASLVQAAAALNLIAPLRQPAVDFSGAASSAAPTNGAKQ
jgi:hypothetical protein